MDVLDKQIPKVLARLSGVMDFRRAAAEAVKGDVQVVVSGLNGSAKALFAAGLWQSARRPILVVIPRERDAAAMASDIEYFHSALNGAPAERVCRFPTWENDPYSGITPHADVLQTRAATLWSLRQKQADIVVASIRAASSRLTAAEQFDRYGLHVRKGDELSQELLVEHLASAGYLRQEPVSAPGEFSVRGGIVDVFSPRMRAPVRMEFFGDSVDSLREFDLDDQRSRSPVQIGRAHV